MRVVLRCMVAFLRGWHVYCRTLLWLIRIGGRSDQTFKLFNSLASHRRLGSKAGASVELVLGKSTKEQHSSIAHDIFPLSGEMHTSDHTVQFHGTDEYLVESISEFISDGLASGKACIVIATPSHRASLEARMDVASIGQPTVNSETTVGCDVVGRVSTCGWLSNFRGYR